MSSTELSILRQAAFCRHQSVQLIWLRFMEAVMFGVCLFRVLGFIDGQLEMPETVRAAVLAH